MAVDNLNLFNLMYLSSAFRYNDKYSVDSYEIMDVEFKYVEIHNNSGMLFKMADEMAPKIWI